jgi:choline dehydrogenase-like flavoprotein
MRKDICIIGSGPAGIAVAMMAAKSGKSILIAESGSVLRQPDDLNQGIIQQAFQAADKKDSELIDGHSLYDPDYIVTGRIRTSGGSSRKWGVRARENESFCLRLACPDAYDFSCINEYNIPAWPIEFNEIERYLKKSASFFGLNEADFRGNGTHAYDFDKNIFEPNLFYFSPASVIYDQRYSEIKCKENIEIQSGWTLTKIVTNSSKEKVNHLEFIDEENKVHKIVPQQVVIAAGGIENSRVLLNALDEDQIKDPYDLLGRWFMDHPHVSLGILKPRKNIEDLGKFHDFQKKNSNLTLGHYSLSEQTASREKLLRFSVTLVGAPKITSSTVVSAASRLIRFKTEKYSLPEIYAMASELIKHPIGTARYAQYKFGRGPRHHTGLGGWSTNTTRVTDVDVLKLEAMMAQRPSPDNRVRLSSKRDRLGNKKACLQWSWSQPEVDSYWRSVKLTQENFETIGAGEYINPKNLGCGNVPNGGTGWHQMGGTRMSSLAEQGSVDTTCRYHGVENLYIAGSSVFPSSIGYANPTLTVVALSLRLGDHLASL